MFRPGLVLRLARSQTLAPAGRRMASTTTVEAENEFIAKRLAMREHAVRELPFIPCLPILWRIHVLIFFADTTDLWRKISFFIAIPGIAVCAMWTYKAEMAHKAHAAHAGSLGGGGAHGEDASDEESEHDGRKVYSYMNIRNKPFPWGMQSLFFNPEINIPAGDAE